MTPRNTQLGASASAARTPFAKGGRSASSTASRTSAGSSRTPRDQSSASARPAKRAANATEKSPRRDQATHRWWLLPLVVIGAIALFIGAFYPVARVEYRETRAKTELQAELTAIQARNARLRTDVARLKTPEGVEDYARVRLGLVKKGEHIVVFVDGTGPTKTASVLAPPKIDSQDVAKPPVGPWTAFLDAFFGVQ